ncbi:FecR/PupR family sigma factor regulator [Achromobacter denitrificans]|uniref:FecR/PupR family sigma factor regulator n=1 Tax=Achromobacter denitrificans TaxID=32002 RepID=UPI00345ED37E
MSAASVRPQAGPAAAGPSIPEDVVDAAIQWYVLLASGAATAQDHAALVRWRAESATHAAAWSRFEAMGAGCKAARRARRRRRRTPR